MLKLLSLIAGMLVVLFAAACGSPATPLPPTPDVNATTTQIAANIFATQTASVPTTTNTPSSTTTSLPTATSSKPTISPDEAIRLLDWTWYRSQTGDYVYIDGEIQNTSSQPMRFVELTIELKDASNKLLSTDRGYIDSDILPSGGISTFKIITPYRNGTTLVGISNIQWSWSGKETPVALNIPTRTPQPPTLTTTPVPTPIVYGFNQWVKDGKEAFSWQAVGADEYTEIKWTDNPLTPNGKFVMVRVDCKADNQWALGGCSQQGFGLLDAVGNLYEEDSTASDAGRDKYFDANYAKMLRQLFFWYTTGVKYQRGTILRDTVAFDVPANAVKPYYLIWRFDAQKQKIKVE